MWSDICVIRFISIDNKIDYSHALLVVSNKLQDAAALSLFLLRKKWNMYVASKLWLLTFGQGEFL